MNLLIERMEREYKCSICDVNFNYFSGLQRHKKTRKHALLAAIKDSVPEDGSLLPALKDVSYDTPAPTTINSLLSESSL